MKTKILNGLATASCGSRKKVAVLSLAIATTICLLFAQGNTSPPGANSWRRFNSPYDPKTRPPIGLTEAYLLALSQMGGATNQLYCLTASCTEPTKRGLPGWTFRFSNTNADQVSIEVSFDKEVDMDARSAAIVKSAGERREEK
jgi:hypothetical protein